MKIEVLEVVENGDGSCNVVFDYDDEFVDLVKKELEKDEVSEEDISQYVVEAIDKGIIKLQQEEKEEE